MNKVILLSITALIVFIAIHPGQVSAQCESAVFCSGFEEGNKDIWDDTHDSDRNPDSTNLIMEEPGPFNTPGNHVMRLRVPEGRGYADIIKVLPESYDKLYLRWYQKWEPGYDFSALNHGGGFHAGPRSLLGHSGDRPNGDDWMSSWLEPYTSGSSLDRRLHLYSYYRGMYMDCSNPVDRCWGDHLPCMFDEGNRCEKPEHRESVMTPQVETNRWYCVEIMVDMGTPVQSEAEADGVQNLWVDDIEYGPWGNLWHRTTPDLKLNTIYLNLFHHADHSVEGIMLDEVVVSTQHIGCSDSGSSPDTLSPSPPENLSILPE